MSLFLNKWWSDRRVRIVVQILLFLVIVLAVRAWTQRGMMSGSVQGLQGQLLEGGYYNLAAVNQRPVLIHFWATWCPICKLEQDTINTLSHDYRVITVAMQSGAAYDVQQYMIEHGLKFPVINDPDGDLASQFGVRAVPSSFIIGANDQIVFRETGYTTPVGLRLRLWIAK